MSKKLLSRKQLDNQKIKVGWWDVFKSTMMSFLGVQKEAIRQRDFEHGNPVHFIIMGILMTILFVLSVVTVVKFVMYLAEV